LKSFSLTIFVAESMGSE